MSAQMSKTRILLECAMMIAMSTVLSMVKLYDAPMGGSVTLCSMLPLLLASHRHGLRWGLLTAFTHSLLQLLLGLDNLSYCPTFRTILICILFDYIIAYTVMGLQCAVERRFKNPHAGAAAGAVILSLLRLLCSFISGVAIWGVWAPEGMPVWLYSISYNAGYMLPEMLLTAIAAALLFPALDAGARRAEG